MKIQGQNIGTRSICRVRTQRGLAAVIEDALDEGRLDRAERLARTALRIADRLPVLTAALLRLQVQQRELAAAEATLEESLTEHPRSSILHEWKRCLDRPAADLPEGVIARIGVAAGDGRGKAA